MGRKKKISSVQTYEVYPVSIFDWKAEYSLRLDNSCKFSDGPYWEHYSLDIRGEFLGPDKIRGREVAITFLADRGLDRAIAQPDSINWKATALGGLTSRGKHSNFIGSLPFQICGQILNMLQCRKIKYVIFSGEVMRYGYASITGISFKEDFCPEDY